MTSYLKDIQNLKLINNFGDIWNKLDMYVTPSLQSRSWLYISYNVREN